LTKWRLAHEKNPYEANKYYTTYMIWTHTL